MAKKNNAVATAENSDLIIVKFIKNNTPYIKGDITGVTPEKFEELSKGKFVVEYDGKKIKEVVEDETTNDDVSNTGDDVTGDEQK